MGPSVTSRIVMGMTTSHALPHRDHRIADVRFERKQPPDTAPLTCTCSWSGTVAGWKTHRGKLARHDQ